MGTEDTSWRRLRDEPQKKHAGVYGVRRGHAPPSQGDEPQQVAIWENEGGGQSALPTEPLRILIVDDDIKSASSLELMLHAAGYSETRVAYSGHAALLIAADFDPGMVLLELGLLDMSGYELARLLCQRTQSHGLRVIAMTPSREHPGRELARAAGFERYLLKPVAARDLAGLIEDPGTSR